MDYILPIASVVALVTLRLLELGTNRKTVAGPVKEQMTFWLFMFAGLFLFVFGITEFLVTGRGLFWPAYLVGAISGIASFALRRRAIAALGRFWSLHVEIRDNHEFVQSGPFRWMRHPTYCSMVLELIAMACMLNAVYSALVSFLFFVPTLFIRVKLEERALVEKFGEAYHNYQKSTPAIFPWKLK